MPTGAITEHFSWGEARCQCGKCTGWGDPHIEDSIRQTAEWAEEVRAALGNWPMRVNSWYRCAAWNKQVGGATNSQHLWGKAIDFTLKDLSPATVQKMLKARWPNLIKGLGSYRGFTHIDRRDGEPALWRG